MPGRLSRLTLETGGGSRKEYDNSHNSTLGGEPPPARYAFYVQVTLQKRILLDLLKEKKVSQDCSKLERPKNTNYGRTSTKFWRRTILIATLTSALVRRQGFERRST